MYLAKPQRALGFKLYALFCTPADISSSHPETRLIAVLFQAEQSSNADET
jgi:hypothetical protein